MQETVPLALDPNALARKAQHVASYYGFEHIADFVKRSDGARVDAAYPAGCSPRELSGIPSASASAFRTLAERSASFSPKHPALIWSTNATPGKGAPKTLTVSFHVIGASEGIADALLVRALYALATEVGASPRIALSSLGDAETKTRYARELTTFFRRHAHALSPECLALARKNPLQGLAYLLQNPDEYDGTLPGPLDHLSEGSRKLFEEVLEYLEESGTPYDLAPHVMDGTGFLSETRFLVRDARYGVLGEGGRVTDLAKKFSRNARGTITGVFSAKSKQCDECKALPRAAKPSIVFIQLGPAAKRASFRIIEELRLARIPLVQTMSISSLTDQAEVADRVAAPYTLIVGHREALEGTAILRNRDNYAQETVPLGALVERLRAIA